MIYLQLARVDNIKHGDELENINKVRKVRNVTQSGPKCKVLREGSNTRIAENPGHMAKKF